MVALWKSKTGFNIDKINTTVRQSVFNKGWVGKSASDRGLRGRVVDLLGKRIGDEYSVTVYASGAERQAYDLIMKESSQGANIFKILREHPGGAGLQVIQIDCRRLGGQDNLYFHIGDGSTA